MKNILEQLDTFMKKPTSKQSDYLDEFNNMMFNKEGIIQQQKLEDYLSSSFNVELPFKDAVSINGSIYQQDFANIIYSLFYDKDKVVQMLKTHDETNKYLLEKLKVIISNLYEAYKDYLVNLIKFYIDNPRFAYPLTCYPQTMLSVPFYEYIKEDVELTYYNKDTKTFLYLKLIEKIVFDRFLELNDETIKEIRDNLSGFTKGQNIDIANIAKRTRDKLYNYNGVKCPDNLIYISLLSEEESHKLAEFTLARYFEEGTSIEALKLAFRGRLGVILENESAYKDNPFYFTPIIIKPLKRGCVSYVFNYLRNHNYISHDHLWDSIANHHYFKARKRDGRVDFVTSNELSQSLGYKMQKVNSINNKVVGKELETLDLFLTDNFKMR